MTHQAPNSAVTGAASASTRTWARWGFGFLIILVLACVMVYGVRQCASTVDRITTMFNPPADIPIVLRNTIERVDREAKLVVSSAEITAEVEKGETYKWWGVYFGTTTARIRAKGCRVQYIIPLEKFNRSNIEFQPEKKIVKIMVPEPVLDESMVDIKYDQLEVYAASAWSRFNKSDVAEEAKKLLRQAALAQGQQPFIQAAVRENARKTVRQLCEPLIESLQNDVRVDIEFGPSK